MITGVGIDLVSIERINLVYQKFGSRFTARILANQEQEIMPQAAISFIAGRFAAKEAAVKALGTGFSQNITPLDIIILNDDSGRPYLLFENAAREVAANKGVLRAHLSISHEKANAVALVILES